MQQIQSCWSSIRSRMQDVPGGCLYRTEAGQTCGWWAKGERPVELLDAALQLQLVEGADKGCRAPQHHQALCAGVQPVYGEQACTQI